MVGRGFTLLTTLDPYEALDANSVAFLERIGAHVVRVLPVGTAPKHVRPYEVVDVDNLYVPYLAESQDVGALVRPDFYVFGTARDRGDMCRLVGDLRRQLTASASLTRPAAAAAR